MPQTDLLILDEFYKLSSKRGDNRNNILNTAFIRIMSNPDCRFYMLGPNIDAIPDGFVEKYNDERIKIIKSDENNGAAITRNKGLEVARGRYVAFLDCDDVWHKDKLWLSLKFMVNNDYIFVCTNYRQ